MSNKTIYSTNDQPGSIIYISHGGGPWPLLKDPRHSNLIDFLKELPSTLISPSAIVVISAHWKERQACLSGLQKTNPTYEH